MADIYFKEKVCPGCERVLLNTELKCIECGVATHILVNTSDPSDLASWKAIQYVDCFRLDAQIRHLLTGLYIQDVVSHSNTSAYMFLLNSAPPD